MKLLKYVTLALVAGLLLYGTGAAAASSGTDDIFETALTTILAVFKNVRYIVYVIGGFGLIGLAVAAILGKMQFKWLVYVALGLAIVAAADMIVSYATNDAVDGADAVSNWDVSDMARDS
ncbi:MAG: TrbC/VirB2 family protein [Alphaproteobacteria bacterium]|nr:TrbC/VirB2 family protein [Alphaproteobacteria bacterium]